MLSAVKIGIDKLYEINQSKISLSFSKEEEVFHDEETVYIKFNNDVSKVFIKLIFDGKINHLTKVDNIKIKLPVQVTAQKMKKYEHLYELEDRNQTIVIYIKDVLGTHKKYAESDKIVLGFNVIKSLDIVDSQIETTIHNDRTLKKPEFKFNKVTFTK